MRPGELAARKLQERINDQAGKRRYLVESGNGEQGIVWAEDEVDAIVEANVSVGVNAMREDKSGRITVSEVVEPRVFGAHIAVTPFPRLPSVRS